MGNSRLARGAAHLALLGVGIGAGLLVAMAPAAAHTELRGVDPPVGAVIDAPPAAVSFTYSAPVSAELAVAAVTPPGGPEVRLGAERLAVTDATVTVALAGEFAGAPAGDWSVVLRVVSADGHPVESAARFTTTSTSAEATPLPPVTDTATATVVASAAPTPAPSATEPLAMVPISRNEGWPPGAVAAVVIAAVAVVGGAGAFALARRR